LEVLLGAMKIEDNSCYYTNQRTKSVAVLTSGIILETIFKRGNANVLKNVWSGTERCPLADIEY
jgi:hypothetical protein